MRNIIHKSLGKCRSMILCTWADVMRCCRAADDSNAGFVGRVRHVRHILVFGASKRMHSIDN